MMRNLAGIILAAGKGTRMKSTLPKVLHPVSGRPMLHYPLRLLKGLKAKRSVVVVGYGAGLVEGVFSGPGVKFVTQKEQLGTGHAVMSALGALKGFKGDVLILSGDVPLITASTVKALFKVRGTGRSRAVISIVTMILDDPTGYGRVIRDGAGRVVGTVEHKDCSAAERSIREVNSGLYLIDSAFLFKNIKKLGKANAQGEYYLPDLIRVAVKDGLTTGWSSRGRTW
jgi:UDP-N-acetylglucosamine diphosphorylase/glucosamine-1-phosphate N-acetyltransferase